MEGARDRCDEAPPQPWPGICSRTHEERPGEAKRWCKARSGKAKLVAIFAIFLVRCVNMIQKIILFTNFTLPIHARRHTRDIPKQKNYKRRAKLDIISCRI